ncbi:hypothetical protein PSOL_00270 [Candidatus Phytoplasma solani]
MLQKIITLLINFNIQKLNVNNNFEKEKNIQLNFLRVFIAFTN